MVADDVKRNMKIKYKGYAHYVQSVDSPDPAKKDGTPKMCRWQLRTRLGHHGTVIQVAIPYDTPITLLGD